MAEYLSPVIARLQMDVSSFIEGIAKARAALDGLKKNIDDTVKVKYETSGLKDVADQAERLSGLTDKTMKIKLDMVDGTRTWAELIAIEHKMDSLNGKTATVKVDVDQSALSRVSSLLRTLGGNGGGFLSNFPALGALPGGAGGVGAIAGIAAAAAAALPYITMLASGLVAAGAGAAAFGALAYPAFSSVKTALSNLTTAQDAYAAAQAKYQVDPSKTNATALKSAADNVKAAQLQIKQLGPAAASAVAGIQQLTTAGGNLAQAFAPTAFKIINDLIKVANAFLPAAMPLATAFAGALDPLLQKLAAFGQSKGFSDFVKSLSSITGPALTALGTGIANVVSQFGKLMTIFSGKDVAASIRYTFTAITGALIGLRYTINGLRSAFDHISQWAKSAFDGMGIAVHNAAATFDSLRHSAAHLGDDILNSLKSLLKLGPDLFSGLYDGAKTAVSKTLSFFQALPGEIRALFSSAASWLQSAGSNIIHGLENGAVSYWGNVSSWFSGLGGKIRSFFAGAAGWLVSAGRAILEGLLSGMEAMAGPVISWVTSMASKIASAFSSILHIHSPSLVFYEFGMNIAEGLAQGMMAGAGHVASAADMLAAAAAGGSGSWVRSSGAALVGSPGGSSPALAGSAGLAGGGGGVPEIHNHFYVDGKEVATSVQKYAVQTQKRTGANGMQKRTR